MAIPSANTVPAPADKLPAWQSGPQQCTAYGSPTLTTGIPLTNVVPEAPTLGVGE